MKGTGTGGFMKRVRFLLTVLLGAVFTFGLAVFAACAPDEPVNTTTATLTLQPGEGGTIAQNVYEVNVGTDLTEYLKEITPTVKQDLTFAGWYKGNTALGAGEKMPEGGLTLTAKYYANYVLEIYREDAEGNYGEPERTTGKAFYGESFSYNAQAEEHYDLDESAENKLTSEKLGIGETFSVHYKREIYYVYYNQNLPDGVEVGGSMSPESCRYGLSVTIADCAFEAPANYRFAGWALSEDGAAEYEAGASLTPEENVTLFAVWEVGYTDRFGGGDVIFFPEAEENVAILFRTGEEHVGVRTGDAFTFSNESGEILQGKVNADGTFVYFRTALADKTYPHGDAYHGTLHEDGATIKFNGFDEVTYKEGDDTLTGTVAYDPATMYYTFTDGNIVFDFMLTEVSSDEGSVEVFFRSGAEVGSYLGVNFAYENGEMKALQGNTLFLDGFGVAALFDTAALMNDEMVMLLVGTYVPSEDDPSVVELSLYDSEYEIHSYRAKLVSIDSGTVWLIYYKDYDREFTGEEGASLTLDGFSGTYESAVYKTADGAEEKGMYVVEFSPLGYSVRFIRENGEVTTFRIDLDTSEFYELGDGDYAEYLRYFGDSAELPVYAPVLVFGDNNSATLYEQDGTERKGTVSSVTGTQHFLFSSDEVKFEYELGEGYFEIFGQIYYFHYYKMYLLLEEADLNLTEKDGNGKFYGSYDVYSAQGDAVYTDGNGETHVGVYSVQSGEDMMISFDLVEFADISTGVHYFFRFIGTEGNYTQFVILGGETGVYYLYEEGAISGDAMLILICNTTDDGKTERIATYMDLESFSMGSGSYTYDSATGTGVVNYTDMIYGGEYSVTFTFVEIGEECYFTRHTSLWEGEKTFTNENGTKLVLDGFGFGTYDGAYEGQYLIAGKIEATGKENAYRIYFYGSDATASFEGYFDIDLDSETYTACGYEVGQYNASDDSGDLLWLDGYGKAIRYNIHEYDGEDLRPLEEGEYELFVVSEDEIIRLTFGGKSYYAKIWASFDGEEYINYYTVAYEGAGTYVSENWETLSLDEYGNAIFTDVYGITYEGTYTRLAERTVSFDGMTEEAIFVLGEDQTFTHPTEGYVIDGDTLVKYLGDMETPEAIKIPNGVKKIAPLAFSVHEYGSRYRGVNVSSVDFNEVEEIGANAFNGCAALTSVKGDRVRSVGESAFYACIELVNVDFANAEEINEFAFWLCGSLEEVKLPKVKTIFASAFSGCDMLVRIELPAIEKLYEGVFYDCSSLESVVLGENLTQIGTPEESVAGVFERSYGLDFAALKVELKGKNVPDVGHSLFSGVGVYTVIVPDSTVLKQFYQEDGWSDYAGNVGIASSEEYSGVYYSYSYSVTAFVLDGLLRKVDYSIDCLGTFEVRDNILYLITYDASVEGKYVEKAKGVFLEDGRLLYDRYGYGLDEENYENFQVLIKAGTQVSLNIQYENEGDKLEFVPKAGNVFAAGVVYETDATWTNNNEKKDAKVRLELDSYYSSTFYMIAEGNRYRLSPSVNYTGATVSLGIPEFDPIVKYYTAENESILAISQNDREGTQYTASFVLADILDDSGRPFSLAQVALEKTDENTFKTREAHVFGNYSYSLTFVVDGESFTYMAEIERRMEILSSDNKGKVVIYQNAAGEISSVLLYVDQYGDWTELNEATTNFEKTQEGSVYRWLVYEYNYAGDYVLTLSGSGDSLRGTLEVKAAVKGYLDGVYAIAFFEENKRTALYMRGSDGTYEKIEDSNIKEKEGYLEVTFKGDSYYVTLNLGDLSATIVFADKTFFDYEGENSVQVVRNASGEIESMTLTFENKTYTNFTEQQGEYGSSYYVFTDETDYFRVEIYTSNCMITKLVKREYEEASTKLKLTLLVDGSSLMAVQVLTATLDGKTAEVTFENRYISGKDYAYLLVKAEGSEKKYLAETETSAIYELKEVVVSDENYQITMLATESGVIYSVLKFEVKTNGEFVSRPVSWYNPTSGDDERNYEIGVGDTDTSYFFKISYENGEWTLKFIKEGY